MTSSAFDRDTFAEWIVAQGGTVQPGTNEWEVLRYRTSSNETGVVYRNKKGELSYTERSRADLAKFLADTNFAPAERVNRLKAEWTAKTRAILLERDGPGCVFCGQFLDRGELRPTIEHFHALAKTGNNHPDNLALACEGCNGAVGNDPVVKKIAFRDHVRSLIADVPPWQVVDTRALATAKIGVPA
ncbi:HNH endonuclease [Aureimonas flava]|uniref:HNH endonuclease n=1 Tax=Aureimonas flava TaxID=2320271 RepID=A0A3A1WJX9_9HYPH|nr:HNH endonuclease signature motif containing protein [Aureimonas flava]RIY00189.1 HNH endonuclease [Aureimonas flava]